MKAARLAIAGIVFAFFALPFAAAQEQAAVLEYFGAAGQIRVVDSDGFETSDVRFGMDLAVGDRIITRNTTAEIRLSPSGSIVKLSANTEFRIDGLAGVKKSDKNGFSLLSGKLRTVVARGSGGRFEVRTPTAVCGVRGTDFGVQVITGAMEAVAVREGVVSFMKNSGAELSLGAGQAADAFAAVFRAMTLSAAEMSEAFRGMDFEKLNPEAVPKEPPRPVAEKIETPPGPAETPPEPPKDSLAGEPGILDPIFGFLREYMGMEVGSITIAGETYSRVILQPFFTIGKFKAAFYLPVIYTGDLFNSNDWYHPRGNNEWSFGTDYNWNRRPLEAAGDLLRDLALKIRYIEYGRQRDPFFVKVGNISDMTLGHGSLVRRFANDTDFPAVRRVGVNLGVDAGKAGFEALTADLAEPEIFGGRLYFRPLHPFRLGFGFSAATDIDPAGDLPDDYAATLPTDPRSVDPAFIGVAADIDFPLFEGDLASMIFFVDGAGLLPYLRNEYAAGTLGTRGLITDAFVTTSGGVEFRNYGLMAGVFGNIAFLDYRLEYRQHRGLFSPGFFGIGYDRLRGARSAELLAYLNDPSLPDFDATTLGIYGEAGFSLFQHLRFEAGYLWPFELEGGKIQVTQDDYLEMKLVLEEGLIPISPFDRLRLSLFFSRYQFLPTLLKQGDGSLELFDANTVVKGELVYPVAPTIDLALTVTTTVSRNPDGSIRYDSDGHPKWTPSIGIETRIRF